MKLHHPALVKSLRTAYSAEKAASLAYIGHASSPSAHDDQTRPPHSATFLRRRARQQSHVRAPAAGMKYGTSRSSILLKPRVSAGSSD